MKSQEILCVLSMIMARSLVMAWSGVGLLTMPKQYASVRPTTSLSVASSPPSSDVTAAQQLPSEDELVLQAGRILEGGKVIDFSAVKATSTAEDALARARENLLLQQQQGQTMQLQGTEGGILGINQDVIDEVGHPLGSFATPEIVQDCATYLRSQAPAGVLEVKADSVPDKSVTITEDNLKSFEELIEKAYEESGEVTAAFAKTFHLGTMLMPVEAREAIWAVYVWCRRTDEIVDAPRDNDDDMLSDLSAWEMRLENLWKYGEVHDVFDLCLLDIRIRYPNLEITPFMDMIRGMLMDVPDLGQERYETFDELHLYCYRVAGTVGLMSLPIFGCAPGYTDEVAKEPALSLGVAFQLTNILRDVGEDAKQRGRIYLPREDMERFGVTEEQIYEQRINENYIAMMQFEIARARMYYERARRGVYMLAEESRWPVQSSLDAYGKILEKIEENYFDNLTKRAYVDKWEKLATLPFSWYRTTELSRIVPLPGDKVVVMDEA